MKVRGGKDFAIGYYRFASHDLLAVEQCPISSPLINRALSAVWEMGRSSAIPLWLAEIEFFANAQDDLIMLELYLRAEADMTALEDIARRLREAEPAIAGISAFAGQPTKKIWNHGAEELLYRTQADSYHVRAGSFFQTNRYLTDKLVDLVIAGQKGEFALDLYAGTGLFTLPLAGAFKRVTAVEAAPESYADLRTNAAANVECRRATTEEFLRARLQVAPDVIVVDPPRAGLGDKVTGALNSIAARSLIYVSCDPATLARDLRELMLGGYQVQSIALVDLFPQTFHIETVVHLHR
jgi:23S rRNA (uracil1939-C5)-methyltransferase